MNSIYRVLKKADCSYRDSNGMHIVNIKEGVEVIPTDFFERSNINAVEFPSTLKRIECDAFRNAKKLQVIEVPAGVTYIGSLAFAGCESLEYVSLPDGLKVVNVGTFEDTSIKFIRLPKDLEVIGSLAFSNILECFEVQLPSTVSIIADRAFANSRYIVLGLNEGIKYIGHEAFENVNSMHKNYTKPDSVVFEEEMQCIYKKDYDIVNKKLIVHDGVKIVNRMWTSEMIEGIEEVYLPNSVVYIGNDAFFGFQLKKVHMSNCIEYIGSNAFRNGGNVLEYITYDGCTDNSEYSLPSTLKSLGNGNFSDNKNIKIIIPSTCSANRSYFVFEDKENVLNCKYSELLENERNELESLSLLPEQIRSNVLSLNKCPIRSKSVKDSSVSLMNTIINTDYNENRDIGIIVYLINNGLIDVNNLDDSTINTLIYKSYNRTLCLLLSYGLDVYKYNLITDCSYLGNYEMVRILLMMNTDINYIDKNGFTALMYAASTFNERLVKLLVDSGADIYVVNKQGYSALDGADSKMLSILKGETKEVKNDTASDLRQLELLLGGRK